MTAAGMSSKPRRASTPLALLLPLALLHVAALSFSCSSAPCAHALGSQHRRRQRLLQRLPSQQQPSQGDVAGSAAEAFFHAVNQRRLGVSRQQQGGAEAAAARKQNMDAAVKEGWSRLRASAARAARRGLAAVASGPGEDGRPVVRMPLVHRTALEGIPFNSAEHAAEQLGRVVRRILASNNVPLKMGGLASPYGSYYIQLEIGTPPQYQSLVFDTGSSLLWTSCDCIQCPTKSTLVNLNPFQTSESSTDSEVACSSDACELSLAFGCPTTGQPLCAFKQVYGDNSTASGPVLTDVLTLPTATGTALTFNSVVFGCGQIQTGNLLGGNTEYTMDGIVGMGRGQVSTMSQLEAAGVLPFVFAFCLDGNDPYGSHAVLGRAPGPPGLKKTNLLNIESASYYYIDVLRLRVGNTVLSSSEGMGTYNTETRRGGVIVDSGTTYTTIPNEVYVELVNQIFAGFTVSQSQFSDCISLDPTDASVLDSFPNIYIDLPDGVSWEIPPENYLVYIGDDSSGSIFCCGAVPTAPDRLPVTAIVGETWLRDTYVRMDRDKMTLEWAEVNCTSEVSLFGFGPPAPPSPPYPPGTPVPPTFFGGTMRRPPPLSSSTIYPLGNVAPSARDLRSSLLTLALASIVLWSVLMQSWRLHSGSSVGVCL